MQSKSEETKPNDHKCARDKDKRCAHCELNLNLSLNKCKIEVNAKLKKAIDLLRGN